MHPPRTFAVLVGIDDYSALDRSLHLPRGTSDNGGAVYDAFEWFHLVRELGARNGDIVILDAPVGDAPRPVRGGERVLARVSPTRERILAAAAWLRRELRLNPGARGIFLYSGHGEVDARGVATLCAVEAAWHGGTLTGTVAVDELVEALGGADVTHRLTLILDTCHAGATGVAGPDRARRAGRPSGVSGRAAVPRDFPFPALVACGPTERSYEIPVGRVWRGAFSWALMRVIQRWGLATEGTEIACGELVLRAGAILTAMGVDQHPAYQGPPQLRGAALFLRHPASDAGPMALGDKEIDPGTCDLRSPTGETVGRLYATPPAPPGAFGPTAFAPETVYWWGDNPAGNPLLTMDVFDLVRTTDTPLAPPTAPWMVHANGTFQVWIPGAPIPWAPRWYRWSRIAVNGGPPTNQGWLGVSPGSPGIPWKLTWLSSLALDGRARLASGEAFRFEHLAGPPPPNIGIQSWSEDVFTMP